MLNAMISSSSIEPGVSEKYEYVLSQEVGASRSRSGNGDELSFETRTIGFASADFQWARGGLNFPFAISVFSKNLGNSSELVSPAAAAGVSGYWSWTRNQFSVVRYIENKAKTYAISRKTEIYSVDSGMSKANWLPWRTQFTKIDAEHRVRLSPRNQIEAAIYWETYSAKSDAEDLSASRSKMNGRLALRTEQSRLHSMQWELSLETQRRNFAGDAKLKEGSARSQPEKSRLLAKEQSEFVLSDRGKMSFSLAGTLLSEEPVPSVVEGNVHWLYLLNHHWTSDLSASVYNDVLSLEAEYDARMLISAATNWRLYAKWEAECTVRYDATVAGLEGAAPRFEIESQVLHYIIPDLAIYAQFEAKLEKRDNEFSRTDLGIWAGISWPREPEKKEM